jgi:hypothetical protein
MAETIFSQAQNRPLLGSYQRTPFTVTALGVGLVVTLQTPSATIVDEEGFESLADTSPVGSLSPSSALQARFQALVTQWKNNTLRVSSDLGEALMDWPYQQIIGLGPRAIPLILDELRREPNHWGWALQSITGENPVPEEAAGDLRAIAQAWLQWGRDQHLIG